MPTHRINSIDIARLLAAILVVAIHTQAVTWLSGYPLRWRVRIERLYAASRIDGDAQRGQSQPHGREEQCAPHDFSEDGLSETAVSVP